MLATGRYLSEGFDDARLDTLFLTLPISWRGTLSQYAGRLSRLYAGKQEVTIYDYVDAQEPMLARMAAKRAAGYRSQGYRESANETLPVKAAQQSLDGVPRKEMNANLNLVNGAVNWDVPSSYCWARIDSSMLKSRLWLRNVEPCSSHLPR